MSKIIPLFPNGAPRSWDLRLARQVAAEPEAFKPLSRRWALEFLLRHGTSDDIPAAVNLQMVVARDMLPRGADLQPAWPQRVWRVNGALFVVLLGLIFGLAVIEAVDLLERAAAWLVAHGAFQPER